MKLNFFTLFILLTLGSMKIMAQNKINLIVGTYTNGSSKGIYSFCFDQSTGKAHPLDTLELMNPSFITFSKDGTKIYSVCEIDTTAAAASAISFDRKSGKMKLMNTQHTDCNGPCYISTNGDLVLTANYTGGGMSVFPLAKDGSLKPMSQIFLGTTAPSDMPQQHSAHVHCAQFTTDGKYVLATDFSANRLMRFEFAYKTKLKSVGTAAIVSRNSGPRHFVFSHNNQFMYVISELTGAVTVFKYGNGEMQRLQEIQSDSVGGHGGADIHISPDGRFLYTSNRLKDDGISVFTVNIKTGLINKIGYQLTGIHPRNFNITPNGKFLLCACRDSNIIQVFSINKATGLLTNTKQDIDLDKPVCVQFYTPNKNK